MTSVTMVMRLHVKGIHSSDADCASFRVPQFLTIYGRHEAGSGEYRKKRIYVNIGKSFYHQPAFDKMLKC